VIRTATIQIPDILIVRLPEIILRAAVSRTFIAQKLHSQCQLQYHYFT